MYIDIIAGTDRSNSEVRVSGSSKHVITDTDRTAFGLGDHALKGMVDSYFGKRPDDAYLKSPTPWNDLYKTYKWPQVQVVVRPIQARILSISSEPTVVKTDRFENTFNDVATFTTKISESLSNTVTSNWSENHTISVGQKISYGIEFLGSGVTGETSMNYSNSWGKGGSKSQTVTVGSESGVSVELDPGEKAVATLSASRGKMRAEVRYRATLTGNTAINYGGKHKGHHFWSLGINGVIGNRGTKQLEYTETIECGYYSEGKVSISTDDTSKKTREFSLEHQGASGGN